MKLKHAEKSEKDLVYLLFFTSVEDYNRNTFTKYTGELYIASKIRIMILEIYYVEEQNWS